MLLELLKSLLRRGPSRLRPGQAAELVLEELAQGDRLVAAGRLEEALLHYVSALDADPHHLIALNQAALCLNRLNRNDESLSYFRRAAALDDTFTPGLVNLAIELNDRFLGAEAERHLRLARELDPGAPHIDGVLAVIMMRRGRPAEARELHLSAWLKRFDWAEFAHCFVFVGAYMDEIPPDQLTAEHVFWAETMPEAAADSAARAAEVRQPAALAGRRIRIGYLSADLHEHSVRYFVRPLLENHDRSRFEVFVYHDTPREDVQTQAIAACADHFRRIANQPDADVVRLLRDDRLDVLVELAGHTSTSRVHLFRERLATLQMNALGYPPTTGLRQMDYKVMDEVTAPPGSEGYYSERPLRLAGSFWCFNPMGPTPDVAEPPALQRGHVTFGCFGNVSKISQRVLALWSRIMSELPDSRLILKAITFQDEDAMISVQHWLGEAGIDVGRVEFHRPEEARLHLASHANIDIVLDTFPFNGGTTSCFALWMGVPMVTLAGQALVSRMGASMLHVLGLDDLVTEDDDGYVRAAVALARDPQRLARIRAEMRPRMLATPLGNGEMYARDFERACQQALQERLEGTEQPDLQRPLPVLDEDVVFQRLTFVASTGQPDSARRIGEYGLRHHPDSVRIRIACSGLLEACGEPARACEVLSGALDPQVGAAPEQRLAVEVNLARLELGLGRYEDALRRSTALLQAASLDPLGNLHCRLCGIAAAAWSAPAAVPPAPSSRPLSIAWVVHCDDDNRFADFETSLRAGFGRSEFGPLHRVGGGGRVARCVALAMELDTEWVVFARPQARLLGPAFVDELAGVAAQADVVAAAGADRVAGLRWFDAGFESVHGALALPRPGKPSALDLSVYGSASAPHRGAMRILDATLFAVRRSALRAVAFAPDLDGEHSLCEYDWFQRAAQQGLRLVAAPRLAVANLDPAEVRAGNWGACARAYRERHGLGENEVTAPVAGASVPLPSPQHAWPLLQRYYAA